MSMASKLISKVKNGVLPLPRGIKLAAALDARREIGKKCHVELLFTSSNTLSRDHPAVTRLTSWATAHGVSVSFPAP